MLAVSKPGATSVVAPVILGVGTVFAVLVSTREFVGRAEGTNDSVPAGRGLWWLSFVGVAYGTAVMVCILRLMRPG
jgi:hypothetical protein